MGCKLTLVAAPAGFVKTTLLSKWWKGRGGGERCDAWLSLDEGNDDPTRFLSYLIAAIERTVEEEFGEGILAALLSPSPRRWRRLCGPRLAPLWSPPTIAGSDVAGRVASSGWWRAAPNKR
jgi:hypothetical protein